MKSLKELGLAPVEKEDLVATIGGGYPDNPALNPIGPPIECCYNIPPIFGEEGDWFPWFNPLT